MLFVIIIMLFVIIIMLFGTCWSCGSDATFLIRWQTLGNVTLPQQFFKYFVSKNQLPGLSVSGTLVKNGLKNLVSCPFYSDLVSAVRWYSSK